MLTNAADELLYSITDSDKERIALYSSNKKITYRQYIELVDMYVEKMKYMGRGKHIKIGILMDDCIELICLFWSCIKCGIVPILINNKFAVDTIEKCINSIELNNVVVKDQMAIFNKLETMGFTINDSFQKLQFLKRKSVMEKEIEKTVAFGIFTSGSTGIPKCVLHTHDSMIKCVEYYYRDALNLRADDVIYSASKMMHTYGLGNTVFQTVGIRASAIVCDSGTAYSVINNIEKFKPTILFAVPSIYREILKISIQKDIDLSSLRMCFSAGERLDKSIFEEFKNRFKCIIYDGMGNTEYLTTFITNTPGNHKIGSCGKCINGFEGIIVNNRNETINNGEVGRLLIKGDIHLRRYYNEKKIYTSDDYFDTGNLCYKDQDEYIWFYGRSNDIYKVKGRWLNPVEIENLLSEFDEIQDALVVLDTNSAVNKSLLYIELKNPYIREVSSNKEVFFHRIKVFLKKKIEHYKCPDTFIIVKEIPKGATGKKIRKVIAKEET